MGSALGSSGWPALSWENQTWTPIAPTGMMLGLGDFRQQHRPENSLAGEPYQSAVPADIQSLMPQPNATAVRLADLATIELGRFDAELGARVSTFAPVLLRSEAASSSQIENLTASARAIFSAELGAKRSRNAEQIVANTNAMQAAIDLSSTLLPETVARMHEVLMAGQPRHTPGQWRNEPVWIGTKATSPLGAEYVAPHHTRIPGLMKDVMRFTARRDIHALTAIAVAHAQFETIHPFSDGNGRTGRALAQAGLRHHGITRNVAVPVSAGLLADINGYVAALTSYREGDVSPIVIAFAEASLRAVHNARELVSEIEEIKQRWASTLAVRKNSGAWRLLDIFATRPVLSATAAAQLLGVQVPNVYKPLQALVDAGVVKSKTEHQLGPFWRADEILEAIDRFAERAGRRTKR